jgi:predicted nuclease with TOPRIM domain
MDTMDTKRTLNEAQKELRDLLEKREQLDRRIKGLAQIIEGLRTLGESADLDEATRLVLSALNQDVPELPKGFTDAVRHLIKHATEPVTAMEIRDELQAAGYGGKTPKHTLISVYTVIGRLKEKGVVSEVIRAGKPAYVTSVGQTIIEAIGF